MYYSSSEKAFLKSPSTAKEWHTLVVPSLPRGFIVLPNIMPYFLPHKNRNSFPTVFKIGHLILPIRIYTGTVIWRMCSSDHNIYINCMLIGSRKFRNHDTFSCVCLKILSGCFKAKSVSPTMA
ncbi:hypothetical protein ACMYSQ_001520 [Aspergillus niger]